MLKAAPAGRAIFVSTGVAVYPRAFWGAYAATKSGMETLVRCWADEVEHTAVRAVIVDPGKMRTRMRAEAYPGEDPATLPDPSEIGPMMVELASADQAAAWARVEFSDWASAGRATA